MKIEIDLGKLLNEARNKNQSGVPMDEAVILAVRELYPENSEAVMDRVMDAFISFAGDEPVPLGEIVQKMLEAVETSAYPKVISMEAKTEFDKIEGGAGNIRQQAPRPSTTAPLRPETGAGKIILIILILAAYLYWKYFR